VNYYRRYVGDYLRDTSSLSLIEHGAYTILLDYYYAEECPLPDDLDRIYRMARAMMPEERRAVDKILTTYFTRTTDGFRNARADHEITVSLQARENGGKGGRPKTEEVNGSETGTITGFETETGTGTVHPPTTNHQPPTTSLQPPTTSQLPTPAAAGVVPCPHVEIIKRYAEHLPMGRQVKPPWKGERAKNLQARWRELVERQSVEWWDQLFEHCAKSKFLTGRAAPRRQGEKPFEVSLDWIVSPSNFQKIIEGAYDG
jgi:uncharacterized protein YdaU (DUF1376 family)